MHGTMKIYLYEVGSDSSMSDVIEDLNGRDMADRVRRVYDCNMKMEDAVKKHVNGKDVFLMDFCKHRESGPGLAKVSEKTKGFNLGEDEAFGEMTAALYDPYTNFIVIQYNHYGPRPGSIAAYFSGISHKSFVFTPRLKDDVLSEIDRKQYNQKFSFSYSAAALTGAHRENLGIGVIAGKIEDALGESIGEVEIIVKKKKGKRYSGMRNQANFMRKIVGLLLESDNKTLEGKDFPIKSAKVTGAMTPDGEPEFLDILNAKIVAKKPGLEKDSDTQMYSFSSRCRLLEETFDEWERAGYIVEGVR